jgi:threonine aldolase
MKPAGHMMYPPTSLVVIENTHNRAGGVIFPETDAAAICTLARDQGLATYCDGARLLNAAIAGARSPAALAAPFDMVGISLSKGLGCPVGSLLAGSAALVGAAVRYRRMLGGAMRQSGILAAAGSYALAHNVDRLADDHANARLIGERLARGDDVVIDLDLLRTNIVVFTLVERRGVPDAAAFVDRCRQRGVLVAAFGPRTVRAVTHLDVDRERCEAAGRIMAEVADGR